MTGKDLIIYILQNNLENEVVLENGVFVGFMDDHEAAAKFNVGVWTIRAWYMIGSLKGYKIGNKLYFPRDMKDPRNGEIVHE